MDKKEFTEWAVGRWKAEVKDRPLINRNRRTLDDVWRQVIGMVDKDAIGQLGPSHDELLAAERDSKDGFTVRYKNIVPLAHIIKANLHESNEWLVKEAAANGYELSAEMLDDYRTLQVLLERAEGMPTLQFSHGDKVLAETATCAKQGRYVAAIRGMHGQTMAVVVHEESVGFSYGVYSEGYVKAYAGLSVVEKAQRYEQLTMYEGDFDMAYDNWQLKIPLPEHVRDVRNLHDLMDKLDQQED